MDIIIPIGILAVVAAGFWWARDRGSYTAGRNSAARQCDDCGQLQHQYCDTMENWDNGYWIAMGEIKNPACKCHKDTQ